MDLSGVSEAIEALAKHGLSWWQIALVGVFAILAWRLPSIIGALNERRRDADRHKRELERLTGKMEAKRERRVAKERPRSDRPKSDRPKSDGAASPKDRK